jgi:hypothetical protein
LERQGARAFFYIAADGDVEEHDRIEDHRDEQERWPVHWTLQKTFDFRAMEETDENEDNKTWLCAIFKKPKLGVALYDENRETLTLFSTVEDLEFASLRRAACSHGIACRNLARSLSRPI